MIARKISTTTVCNRAAQPRSISSLPRTGFVPRSPPKCRRRSLVTDIYEYRFPRRIATIPRYISSAPSSSIFDPSLRFSPLEETLLYEDAIGKRAWTNVCVYLLSYNSLSLSLSLFLRRRDRSFARRGESSIDGVSLTLSRAAFETRILGRIPWDEVDEVANKKKRSMTSGYKRYGWKRADGRWNESFPVLGEICSARDSSFYGVLRRGCHGDGPWYQEENRKIK